MKVEVILDPHPESDQHPNLNTFRGSVLAHAYQVWSASVEAVMNCFADKWSHTHRCRHTYTLPAAPLYRDAQVITIIMNAFVKRKINGPQMRYIVALA